jgi:hypothetical protein
MIIVLHAGTEYKVFTAVAHVAGHFDENDPAYPVIQAVLTHYGYPVHALPIDQFTSEFMAEHSCWFPKDVPYPVNCHADLWTYEGDKILDVMSHTQYVCMIYGASFA